LGTRPSDISRQHIKAMADAMHFHVRYFDMPPSAPLPKLSMRFRKRPVKYSMKIFISHRTSWLRDEETRILEEFVQMHNWWATR
jgi:hypothetical protein